MGRNSKPRESHGRSAVPGFPTVSVGCSVVDMNNPVECAVRRDAVESDIEDTDGATNAEHPVRDTVDERSAMSADVSVFMVDYLGE